MVSDPDNPAQPLDADGQRQFQAAFDQHRGGRLEAAEDGYRRVLEAAPEHADTLHLLGLVRHQSGDGEEAARLIGEAVRLDGDSALYHTNLAVVLNSGGQFDRAETAAARATELNPEDPDTHYNLGVAQLQLGKPGVAEKSFRRALSLSPENPELFNNLGTALHRQGRAGEAAAAFEAAAGAAPTFAMAWANLGAALSDEGRLEDALEACRKAQTLQPDYAAPFYTEGGILMETGDVDGAEAAYRRFNELAPRQSKGPAALATLLSETGRADEASTRLEQALADDPGSALLYQAMGSLLARQGESEDAVAHLQKAIGLDPDLSIAYFELVESGKVTFDDSALAHMTGMLRRTDVRDDQKVRLNFALALHYDRADDTAQAATYIASGNQLRKSVSAGLGHVHDQDWAEMRAAEVKRLFTRTFIEDRQSMGLDDPTPIFVVGLPRSGTTLVERIIASHSRAAAAGEVRWMEQTVERLTAAEPPYPGSVAEMSESDIHDLGHGYLDHLRNTAGEHERIVDKLPFNFHRLGFISILFPRAKIIHCRRDVRDSGLSCYFQNFGEHMPWTNDLADMGNYIRLYREIMAHWATVLPEPYLELDYEELVGDPEPQTRRLLDYLGLDWENACLDFHKQAGTVQTASLWQVRQPIYRSSVNRWQRYETLLRPLLDQLTD